MIHCTHSNEHVEEVFQRRKLWNQFLHHFAERLKDAVVIDAAQVSERVQPRLPREVKAQSDVCIFVTDFIHDLLLNFPLTFYRSRKLGLKPTDLVVVG